MAERSVDGMLFFNESEDPTHWTDARRASECCASGREFAPRGVEADPAYLAIIARAALKRGMRAAAARLRHADVRDHDARDAPRHRPRRSTRRCSSCTAPPRPACCSWSASTGGCIRTSATVTSISCRCRAAARLARVLVTTLGRPWMPLLRYDIGDVVRVAETRDCACGLVERRPVARARRGPAQRLRERERRDRHAADARRRDPRGARRGRNARAVAARGRHACTSSDPASRDSAAAAADAVGTLLARPIRGEHVSADRARGVRQVPAGEALMRSAGFPLLERGYDGAPFIYLDSASTTPKPRARDRRGRALLRDASARTCTAACTRSPRRRPRSTSARAIASRR